MGDSTLASTLSPNAAAEAVDQKQTEEGGPTLGGGKDEPAGNAKHYVADVEDGADRPASPSGGTLDRTRSANLKKELRQKMAPKASAQKQAEEEEAAAAAFYDGASSTSFSQEASTTLPPVFGDDPFTASPSRHWRASPLQSAPSLDKTFPRMESLAMARSTGFLEVKARHLDVSNAFNQTTPSFTRHWTIGSRDCIKDENRARMQTELGPDVSCQSMADIYRKAAPKWTMQARWKKTEVSGDWVPGPGTYPLQQSKRERSRGWHMGTEERKTFSESGGDTPAPNRYDVKPGAGCARQPVYTVRHRTCSQPPLPCKKELWSLGGSSTDLIQPRKLYDARETNRRGPAHSPKWTFNPRPESSLVPKGDSVPGPGGNKVKFEHSSKIRASPSYGFGTAKRDIHKSLPPRAY